MRRLEEAGVAEQIRSSGSKPRSSRYFIRQGTLHHHVSLHTGVEMGIGDTLLGGKPAMD